MYILRMLRGVPRCLMQSMQSPGGGINDTIITPYPRLHGAADGIKGVGAPIIDDPRDVLTSVRVFPMT